MGKAESIARVAVTYAVGLGLGAAWLWWGPDTGRLWLDGLIADLIATLVVYAASQLHRNSSFYDAYWSVLPPFLALCWWLERDADATDARFWLLMLVMLIWAVRLTGNWIYGFPGLHHEDWRYGPMKESAGRLEPLIDLMGIHVIPTLQVFLGMVPVYVVTREGRDLGWLDIGLFGLAASPSSWWALVGTVAMLAMFLGASIPMMEKRSLARRPAYQDVVDRVPLFVPRPPRRSAT